MFALKLLLIYEFLARFMVSSSTLNENTELPTIYLDNVDNILNNIKCSTVLVISLNAFYSHVTPANGEIDNVFIVARVHFSLTNETILKKNFKVLDNKHETSVLRTISSNSNLETFISVKDDTWTPLDLLKNHKLTSLFTVVLSPTKIWNVKNHLWFLPIKSGFQIWKRYIALIAKSVNTFGVFIDIYEPGRAKKEYKINDEISKQLYSHTKYDFVSTNQIGILKCEVMQKFPWPTKLMANCEHVFYCLFCAEHAQFFKLSDTGKLNNLLDVNNFRDYVAKYGAPKVWLRPERYRVGPTSDIIWSDVSKKCPKQTFFPNGQWRL